MRRMIGVAVGATVVVLALAACSNATQQAGALTAWVPAEAPQLIMEARIGGTLTTTESGCFALIGGDKTYSLQFPHGTLLSEDGDEVTVPGLAPLRVGDEIIGGGGYGVISLSDPPPACASGESDDYVAWQTIVN